MPTVHHKRTDQLGVNGLHERLILISGREPMVPLAGFVHEGLESARRFDNEERARSSSVPHELNLNDFRDSDDPSSG